MTCMEARGEDCRRMIKTMANIQLCLANLELAGIAHIFRVWNLVPFVETYMNAVDELLAKLKKDTNA
jgi:hypothetical protein